MSAQCMGKNRSALVNQVGSNQGKEVHNVEEVFSAWNC